MLRSILAYSVSPAVSSIIVLHATLDATPLFRLKILALDWDYILSHYQKAIHITTDITRQ